jgi:hypothetical protein
MTGKKGYKRSKKRATPSTPQKLPVRNSGKLQKPTDGAVEDLPVVGIALPTARNRALVALGRMRREHLSLSQACRQEHIKPATFRRYVGSAVRQDKPGGRFRATAGDSFRRDVQIPTAHGPAVISIRGSKNARFIANYLNAISEYLRTGKQAKLDFFKGKSVKVNGRNVELVTDPAILLQLAEADVLHLDQLYASASAGHR